jgi:hypothetical protein
MLHMNQTHKKEGNKYDEERRNVFREVQIKAI